MRQVTVAVASAALSTAAAAVVTPLPVPTHVSAAAMRALELMATAGTTATFPEIAWRGKCTAGALSLHGKESVLVVGSRIG